MAQAPEQPRTVRMVNLVFERDLTDDEVEQIRQRTDALVARLAPTAAAHHHDVTP